MEIRAAHWAYVVWEGIRLFLMHEMQTVVTDVRGVCLSVTRLNSAAHTVCAGSFGAAFAKLLWPLVCLYVICRDL